MKKSEKILIGSLAAKHWFPDFYRKTKDTDYILPDSKNKIQKTDTDIVEFHYSKGFDWLLENEGEIASPDALYTIKVSHSFWNVHWAKTMQDISFLQDKGCKVIPEFFDLLYKDWLEIHDSKKKINFDEANSTFFKNTIDRKIPHDRLHEIIVEPNEPAYKKLKYDQSKAKIEEDLFEKLSFDEKRNVCLEETYVIALERFLIPENFKQNSYVAFMRAAKKVIIDLNKGFVPYFFVTNWNSMKFNSEEFNKNIEKVKKYLNVI